MVASSCPEFSKGAIRALERLHQTRGPYLWATASPEFYAGLADLVTALHLAIVVFMIVVILAVPIGGLLGWRWVRNLPLRLVHALIMGYIVVGVLVLAGWLFVPPRRQDKSAAKSA